MLCPGHCPLPLLSSEELKGTLRLEVFWLVIPFSRSSRSFENIIISVISMKCLFILTAIANFIFNKTVCLLLVFFFSTTDTARFFEEMNQDIRIKTSFSS